MTIRKNFEIEIQELKDEVLILGSMVEQAVLNSVTCLKNYDLEGAQKVVDGDQEINRIRFELENRVMILIATQQPMAKDLRLLASFLEIISELERMGDYAKGISIIHLRMGQQPHLKPLIDIPVMAEKGANMLHLALAAFVNEDEESARKLPQLDDEVDDLYLKIYRELMTFVISDPKNIERANWFLWVAHNLERFADRVTNICERTIFVATGQNSEKYSEMKDS